MSDRIARVESFMEEMAPLVRQECRTARWGESRGRQRTVQRVSETGNPEWSMSSSDAGISVSNTDDSGGGGELSPTESPGERRREKRAVMRRAHEGEGGEQKMPRVGAQGVQGSWWEGGSEEEEYGGAFARDAPRRREEDLKERQKGGGQQGLQTMFEASLRQLLGGDLC